MLNEYTTLPEIAPRVGSYFTAYSLACSGAFGVPVAVVNRTSLYARGAVDSAVTEYLQKRGKRRQAA